MRRCGKLLVTIAVVTALVVTGETAAIYAWSPFTSVAARRAELTPNSDAGSVSHIVPAANPDYQPIVLGFGDSVAAATGLPLATAASNDDKLCQRSRRSYVNLVAASRGLRAVNLACDGAGILRGLKASQPIGRDDAPDVVRPSQLQLAQAYARPQLVTLTIGANSVGWFDWLASCSRTDCATAANTQRFQSVTLAAAKANLVEAVGQLAALHPARIVLTGYYDPAAGATGCLRAVGYTGSKINWIRGRLGDLNQAIAEVAKGYPDTVYAPVDFGQHGICSAEPLVQGPTDPAPLHPTAAGQAVIAQAVEAQLS